MTPKPVPKWHQNRSQNGARKTKFFQAWKILKNFNTVKHHFSIRKSQIFSSLKIFEKIGGACFGAGFGTGFGVILGPVLVSFWGSFWINFRAHFCSILMSFWWSFLGSFLGTTWAFTCSSSLQSSSLKSSSLKFSSLKFNYLPILRKVGTIKADPALPTSTLNITRKWVSLK